MSVPIVTSSSDRRSTVGLTVAVCLVGVLVGLGFGAIGVPRALGATDVVMNLNDSGPGSLRDVLAAAAPGDTVQFASGLSGTIELESQLQHSGDLSIVGNGQVTIDGQDEFRIFYFPVGGTISLSGLTLEHGFADESDVDRSLGGAIDTAATTLRLSDMTFIGNTTSRASADEASGGAVFEFDNLDVSDSTFEENMSGGPGGLPQGGAITAQGNLDVRGSTFVNNVAAGLAGHTNEGTDAGGQGGAIYSAGAATVVASTFVGNRAVGNAGSGAAIFGQFLVATNSTFTDNAAGSPTDQGDGVIFVVHPSTLLSDTIDDNTTGPGAGSTAGVDTLFGERSLITARNTIVADNTRVNGDSANCSNPVLSGSDNLEDDATKTCGFDLPAADPDLGPLADNGGATQTQAPQSGSPAIAATPASACTGADGTPLTTDQRGLPRPGNNKTMCDIGAYESQGPDTPVITAPGAGATHMLGETVLALYSCAASADGPPLMAGAAGCVGPVRSGQPIDTATPGSHTFTVTATNTDAETASASVRYTVAAAPTVSITTPASDVFYQAGQAVNTSFSCVEGAGGPGITRCLDDRGDASGAALDTATAGPHTFTVTATSQDGFTHDASVTYTVAAVPTAAVTTPASGAVYGVGQSVKSSFLCADGAGGTGIASCLDQSGRVSGAGLDTASPGRHAFTVTATSGDGFTREVSVSYVVAAGPSAAVTTPARGAVYGVGQPVKTSFSCSEGASGPGIARCLDDTGSASGAVLDTATPGPHTFTVTATSQDGFTHDASVTYTVAAGPKVAIRSPSDGAIYNLHQSVTTSFACSDGAAGPGIASCVDRSGRGSGSRLDTSTPGRHKYAVTAASADGQAATASITYRVLPDNRHHVFAIRARRNGNVSFAVRVPGPGRIDVLVTAWKDNLARAALLLQPAPGRFVFARARRIAHRAGTLHVNVTANRRGRRLVAHPRYRVTLRLWVSYTPVGGRPRSLGFYGIHLVG